MNSPDKTPCVRHSLIPQVFRLSIDFSTIREMTQFHRDNVSEGMEILIKDTLHDAGKRIHHYIVQDKGGGNGRSIGDT